MSYEILNLKYFEGHWHKKAFFLNYYHAILNLELETVFYFKFFNLNYKEFFMKNIKSLIAVLLILAIANINNIEGMKLKPGMTILPPAPDLSRNRELLAPSNVTDDMKKAFRKEFTLHLQDFYESTCDTTVWGAYCMQNQPIIWTRSYQLKSLSNVPVRDVMARITNETSLRYQEFKAVAPIKEGYGCVVDLPEGLFYQKTKRNHNGLLDSLGLTIVYDEFGNTYGVQVDETGIKFLTLTLSPCNEIIIGKYKDASTQTESHKDAFTQTDDTSNVRRIKRERE